MNLHLYCVGAAASNVVHFAPEFQGITYYTAAFRTEARATYVHRATEKHVR